MAHAILSNSVTLIPLSKQMVCIYAHRTYCRPSDRRALSQVQIIWSEPEMTPKAIENSIAARVKQSGGRTAPHCLCTSMDDEILNK